MPRKCVSSSQYPLCYVSCHQPPFNVFLPQLCKSSLPQLCKSCIRFLRFLLPAGVPVLRSSLHHVSVLFLTSSSNRPCLLPSLAVWLYTLVTYTSLCKLMLLPPFDTFALSYLFSPRDILAIHRRCACTHHIVEHHIVERGGKGKGILTQILLSGCSEGNLSITKRIVTNE